MPAGAQGQGESVALIWEIRQHSHLAFVCGKMSFGDLLLAICLHCLRQGGFQVEGLGRSEGRFKLCLRPTQLPPTYPLLCKAPGENKGGFLALTRAVIILQVTAVPQ